MSQQSKQDALKELEAQYDADKLKAQSEYIETFARLKLNYLRDIEWLRVTYWGGKA